MKIHRVIGNLTLSRCHPGYQNARLLACLPVDHLGQSGQLNEQSEVIVVWDELGAGQGSYVAVSDGAEAASPFKPQVKAVDAYCSAILDEIYIDPEAIGLLKIQ